MRNRILNQCIDIARRSNSPDKHPEWDCYQHYTFVVQNNKIIEWGFNRKHTPLTFLGYPSYSKVHAETDAFRKAKGLLNRNKPFEIVNIRLTKSGLVRDSRPCGCCYEFLKNLGCKEIWFTTDIGEFARIRA